MVRYAWVAIFSPTLMGHSSGSMDWRLIGYLRWLPLPVTQKHLEDASNIGADISSHKLRDGSIL